MIQVWRLVRPLDQPALLHQEAVALARLAQLLVKDGFGAVVGGGDEIRRALDADLQMLDLAEIARQTAARFAGGVNHDRHQRGSWHGALLHMSV